MSIESAELDIPGEVRTEAIVENNTEEIVQAAIDTAAAGPEATGAGSAEVALTTFPKLAHAQELQAVVAAAARECGGGIQRRVVVVQARSRVEADVKLFRTVKPIQHFHQTS